MLDGADIVADVSRVSLVAGAEHCWSVGGVVKLADGLGEALRGRRLSGR